MLLDAKVPYYWHIGHYGKGPIRNSSKSQSLLFR